MENVLLVVVALKRKNGRPIGNIFVEMRELIYSSGGNVVDSVKVKIDKPSPNYYIKSGKLAEIRDRVKEIKADLVIFSVDLSPSQTRNIENFLSAKVIDRTSLILDIFARHAKTRDGKLQVALAQYRYLLPRISIIWEKFSKLGGGIGTRGPGEQILERDKRKIRKHIVKLERELERLKKHRTLIRSGRKRRELFLISIVGYTNAGKSTLLKNLTGADILVEDKLFATLDTTTRKYRYDDGVEVLFTDTVGFLYDLPHTIIKAFHSTLEEVKEANLVLVVLDGSNGEHNINYEVVETTLKDIGAEHIPRLVACNKADLMSEEDIAVFKNDFPNAVFISAKYKRNFDELLSRIRLYCDENRNNFV